MDWNHTQAAIKRTLGEMGRADVPATGHRLLFRDRCFVGICFDFESVSAIWLTAIGQLKFLDESGRLIKVVSLLDDPAEPLERKVA